MKLSFFGGGAVCLAVSGEEGVDLIAGGPCSTCCSQGGAADPSPQATAQARAGCSDQGQVETEMQTLPFFPSHVSLPARILPRGRMPFLNVTEASPLPSTGSVRPSSSHLGGIFF